MLSDAYILFHKRALGEKVLNINYLTIYNIISTHIAKLWKNINTKADYLFVGDLKLIDSDIVLTIKLISKIYC